MDTRSRFTFFVGTSIMILFNFFIAALISIIFKMNLQGPLYLFTSGLLDVLGLSVAVYIGLLFYKNILFQLGNDKLTTGGPKNNGNNPINGKNRQVTRSVRPETTNIMGVFMEQFTLDNFGHQLLTGLAIVSLIYLPLDCLTYLIPGVFEFQYAALEASNFGEYFTYQPYTTMIITSFIFNFLVATREEIYFRGFLTKTGEPLLKKGGAFLISAALFSSAHFSYILSPIAGQYSILYPILWAINSFIIGMITAYYIIEKRKIFPLIFAHTINNFISSLVTRDYLDNVPFIISFYKFYLPFFIIGAIILVLKRKTAIYHSRKLLMLMRSYIYALKMDFLFSNESVNKELFIEQESAAIKTKRKSNKNRRQKEQESKEGPKDLYNPENIIKNPKLLSALKRVSFKRIMPSILMDLILIGLIWFLQTFLLISVNLH